jgi:tetratricopeptide (TPR) repeat protein
MMRRESQFDQLFVRVRVNGQEMTAIIDSGAPLTSVFRHAAERVGVVPEELDLQEVGTTSGFGQRSFRTWVGRFDTFEIGDESIRNARLRIIDRARLNYGRNIEVILGGDFLRSHRVLAAYSQRKIYFSYLGGPVFQVMAPMLVGVENGPDDPLHDVIATCGDATGERTPEARGAACSVLIDSGRLKPRDLAPLLQWRAAAHQRAGLFDEALSDLDRLVALEPQRAEPWNSRCWLRATFRRDLQRALEDCSEALRLAPQTPHILDSRALVHLQLGQACEALADYDAAVATDAEQASFLYGRGVARRRHGQTAEGDADIKRAKELSADIEAAYASYGVAP